VGQLGRDYVVVVCGDYAEFFVGHDPDEYPDEAEHAEDEEHPAPVEVRADLGQKIAVSESLWLT